MRRIDDILNKVFILKEKLTYTERVYLKEYYEELGKQYRENKDEHSGV